MLWCFGFAPRDEVLPKIELAANQAIACDGQNAGARTAVGIVKLSQWDWAGAERELAAAVRLDPRRAASHHWYALYLASRGRHREALRESEQAVAVDASVGMQTGRGSILYFGRDWKGLIDRMQSAIQQDSTFAPAHDWLGMGYVQERRFAESIATYERAVDLSAGLAEILAGLGHAYALAGEEAKARAVLEKLRRLDERWYVPPVQIAYVLIGLKETDEAFQMLERAYQEHAWELVFLQVEPWLDRLRSDSRYVALIEKMKFPAIDRIPRQ
jgi:tetratricopeptide (TPR) repeat protein